MARIFVVVVVTLAVVAVVGTVARGSIERRLLFFPSHHPDNGDLTPWLMGSELIGVCRPVKSPHAVWLFCHGNGGQASDRTYALGCFASDDGVYFVEYPGYGLRPGTPSASAFNAAVESAYAELRADFPGVPVGVVGESIGTGPACVLAGDARPPDKIVLIVPFDRLAAVARDRFPGWLVRWLLVDDWDNVAALAAYSGPVEIFGARNDSIIPVAHAQALFASHPSARFTLIPGEHNEWAEGGKVTIRLP